MKIVTRNHPEYQLACLSWNRAIQHTPNTIVFCENRKELLIALELASAQNLQICVRNGRHHYEGGSSVNESFVIDVSAMQAITINEQHQTVSVDAGVKNRELYEKLAEYGYPFPGGGCPTVGVTGLTLGGGWGYSSRYLGLTCDSLMEAEVLLWDGTHIKANHNQHSQLFWRLRGGGISEGVVVKMTYRLPPKEPLATRIFLDYHLPTRDAAVTLLLSYQQWFPTLPRFINLKIVFYRNQTLKYGIKITGIAYANQAQTIHYLQPLLQQAFLVTNDCQTGPVINAYRWIQDNHPEFESYKSGGRFLAKPLTEIQLQTLGNWLEQIPDEASYAAFTLYGLGGAIRDFDHNDTAFAYRQMDYILGSQIVWQHEADASICQNWLINHWPAIESITSGSFLNFPFLPQAEKNYYGTHWEQIQTIHQYYTNKKITP